MRPFELKQSDRLDDVLKLGFFPGGEITSATAPVQFLAGGTTVLDLMKLDVMRPGRLVDLNRLGGLDTIQAGPSGLTLGARATMADVAAHPAVAAEYPAIAEALLQAASPQLRNMATMAGNLLQRTRCPYFRDVSWAACNKRDPGSGCSAIGGNDRRLAVLGTSDYCIANYPGDLAISLVALDARVNTVDGEGLTRSIPLTELHRAPGTTPHIETCLRPGELITDIFVPAGPWTARSTYLKVRDRASYDFALASAAVALDLDSGGIVRHARIAIGAMVTRPWRALDAERWLQGQPLSEAIARHVADKVFEPASASGERVHKPELGRRTLVRALLAASGRQPS